MSDGRKRILGSFTGHKKGKAWNKTRVKYMLVKRRQNLAETLSPCWNRQEIILQRGMVRRIFIQ